MVMEDGCPVTAVSWEPGSWRLRTPHILESTRRITSGQGDSDLDRDSLRMSGLSLWIDHGPARSAWDGLASGGCVRYGG